MNIVIENIAHDKHRIIDGVKYETVGDWKFDEWNNLMVKVSELGDWRYNLLVGLHETIEAYLCKLRGIPEQSITEFDMVFELEREAGLHTETEECGDSPDAPYRTEHQFATKIEKMLADELGVNWSDYDKAVCSL